MGILYSLKKLLAISKESANCQMRNSKTSTTLVLVDLTDIRVTTRVEKKGNRFERLIRHAFMMKTERFVEYTECTQTPISKNRVEVSDNRIEAWVYGAGACVQTSRSQIALR